MAKNTFSLIFLKTSSIPFRLFSYFFEYFKIDNIDQDLEKSLEIIDKYSSVKIDKKFIDVLRGLDAIEDSTELLKIKDEELFEEHKNRRKTSSKMVSEKIVEIPNVFG